MSHQTFVLINDSELSDIDSLRNAACAGFVNRLNGETGFDAQTENCVTLLQMLADSGCIDLISSSEQGASGELAIVHTPSASAGQHLPAALKRWPDSIKKRLAKSIRSTAGALFTFRCEDIDDSLDVFITDWSPCPAACAIAVHSRHEVLKHSSVVSDSSSYFTGIYVRHPLTGDLLPVWVGDWVKPSFGTGAVLVNPAHSVADMEFGKKIGLPMRFALLPEGTGHDPQNWPSAPVIKEGFTLGTGHYDGMGWQEAKARYFEVIAERGLGCTHTDKRLPESELARLVPGERGKWHIDRDTLSIRPYQEVNGLEVKIERYELVIGDLLQNCANIVSSGPEKLIMGIRSQKRLGCQLPALLFDALGPEQIPALELIESAEYAGNREQDQVLELAALVGEVRDRPLVIRKQLLEQVESFLRNCEKVLSDNQSDEGVTPPEPVRKHLEKQNAAGTFKELGKWQKEILKSGAEINKSAYADVIYALTGSRELSL